LAKRRLVRPPRLIDPKGLTDREGPYPQNLPLVPDPTPASEPACIPSDSRGAAFGAQRLRSQAVPACTGTVAAVAASFRGSPPALPGIPKITPHSQRWSVTPTVLSPSIAPKDGPGDKTGGAATSFGSISSDARRHPIQRLRPRPREVLPNVHTRPKPNKDPEQRPTERRTCRPRRLPSKRGFSGNRPKKRLIIPVFLKEEQENDFSFS
jgi:hypothetical protein